MKRFMVSIICVIMFLTSCSENASETYQEDTVSATEYIDIYETEADKSWDIDMLLMIAKSYDLSCGELEFDIENPPAYNEIFPYFIKVGCYNSYTRSMRDEVIDYYDSDKREMSIPCDIVDTFLSNRFNVAVDRESVSYYIPETEVYSFKVTTYEYYYEQVLIDFEINQDGSLMIDVVKYHGMSNSLTPTRTRYCIDIEQGQYRLMSVEQLDAVALLSGDMALTYKNGKVSIEKNNGSDNQKWWLVHSANESEYTIRPASDGKYFLTISSDGVLYAEWFRDETVENLVTYDSDTGYIYCKVNDEMVYIGCDDILNESAVVWRAVVNDK